MIVARIHAHINQWVVCYTIFNGRNTSLRNIRKALDFVLSKNVSSLNFDAVTW